MNYEDRVTKEYVENAIAAKCEVVCGLYVGDDAESQTIDLGFRPKAVLVSSGNGQFHEGQTYYFGGLVIDGYNTSALDIVDNGFVAHYVSTWCYANAFGGHFYIAFR